VRLASTTRRITDGFFFDKDQPNRGGTADYQYSSPTRRTIFLFKESAACNDRDEVIDFIGVFLEKENTTNQYYLR
jgi:hypothetical protein